MIIFTHIPKTAGTTLKYILRKNFGASHIDSAKVKKTVYTAADLHFARKIFPAPKAISGHNLVDPETHINEPGAKIITVLRDPVSRCASHYQDEVLRGGISLSFEEWINKEEHQNLSVKIIAGTDDLEKAKRLLSESYHWVGITEQFNESLKLLKIQVDASLDLHYRRMITASSNNIKKKLLEDPASLKALEKHNELDQLLYDFALQKVFLPAVEKNKEALDQICLPVEKVSRHTHFKYKRSVGFNKFIYRQLVKLFQD